jgi:hypothetical protein
VSDHYAKLLVPGCGGSVDCVHIAWDMCPAGIRSDCKGKEGYPSVVFQVICSHTRKVLGVSGPYYGTWNDKTIARLDDNFKLFMSGGTLSNLNWTWTDDNAAIHQEKGMFLICDGGYHFWKMLICPFKDHVETIGITNRFGHEGFTRTGPDNSLVDGDAPDHGAFNEFTKEEFYNRRRCLISHYMANRERHIN